MARAKPTRALSDRETARVRSILDAIARTYPDARCSLSHRNAYELLIATILSAQCTDARVNMVTPALFARFPNARSLAKGTQEEVEEFIRSTGFFRAKAKNLRATAEAIVSEHGGEVPGRIEDLVKLPGVGRKTALVVLGDAFEMSEGVVVDTHVKRLAYRLGLTKARDPVKVEVDLQARVPREEWVTLSHRLIQHGRAICGALRPLCDRCPLAEWCPKQGVAAKKPKKAKPKKSG